MPAKILIVDDEKDFLDDMAERMPARDIDVSRPRRLKMP